MGEVLYFMIKILCFLGLYPLCVVASFSLPQVWAHNEKDLACEQILRCATPPEGLTRYMVRYDTKRDSVILRNSARDVMLEMPHIHIANEEGFLLKILVNCTCCSLSTVNNSVLFCTETCEKGSLIFKKSGMLPHAEVKAVLDTTGRLIGQDTTFCEYSAHQSHLSVKRFLLHYENGTQFFIKVHVDYHDLAKVVVSWGEQSLASDGIAHVNKEEKDTFFLSPFCRR